MSEDVIEHHGVRGQKWGVRRKKTSISTSKAPQKESGNKESSSFGDKAVKATQAVFSPKTKKQDRVARAMGILVGARNYYVYRQLGEGMLASALVGALSRRATQLSANAGMNAMRVVKDGGLKKKQ